MKQRYMIGLFISLFFIPLVMLSYEASRDFTTGYLMLAIVIIGFIALWWIILFTKEDEK